MILETFNAIGFDLESTHDLMALCMVAAEAGHYHPVEGLPATEGLTPRYYVHWGPDAGVEYWGHADVKKMPIGARPHFVGSGRVLLRPTRMLPTEGAPLDGAVLGEVLSPVPHVEDAGNAAQNAGLAAPSMLYPLAVHLPDFAASREVLEQPDVVAVVQIAAFAQEIRCFDSDEQFRRDGGPMAVMATESVIPTGTFRVPDDDTPARVDAQPSPMALIVGHVETAELRQNALTQKSFWWISVRTYGGWVDMVAAADDVRGQPVPNGVVGASCWLSGVVDPDRRLKSFGLPPVERGPAFAQPLLRVTPDNQLVPLVPDRAGTGAASLPPIIRWMAWWGPLLTFGNVLSIAAPAQFPGLHDSAIAGTVLSAIILLALRGKPRTAAGVIAGISFVTGLTVCFGLLLMRLTS